MVEALAATLAAFKREAAFEDIQTRKLKSQHSSLFLGCCRLIVLSGPCLLINRSMGSRQNDQIYENQTACSPDCNPLSQHIQLMRRFFLQWVGRRWSPRSSHLGWLPWRRPGWRIWRQFWRLLSSRPQDISRPRFTATGRFCLANGHSANAPPCKGNEVVESAGWKRCHTEIRHHFAASSPAKSLIRTGSKP